MRIALVTSLVHPSFGGPPAVVRGHAQMLRDRGHDVSLFATVPSSLLAETQALFPEAKLFPQTWPLRWYRGSGLVDAIHREAQLADVIHVHMLWDHPLYAAVRTRHTRRSPPVVVSPHGSTMTPERRNGFHKRVYRSLILDSLLRQVASVHALNDAEAHALRDWGYAGRIDIVPNGVPRGAFDASADPGPAWERWPFLRNGSIYLFLGRLGQEKGLANLLRAWKLAPPPLGHLVLAGPDYRGNRHVLQSMIADLQLGDSVHLVGPVAGRLKTALLGASSVFVLPSITEGFSMALLDAMAARLPILCTSTCNQPDVTAAGAGWEVSPSLGGLLDGLRSVARVSPDELRQMGHQAWILGRSRYTLEGVAGQLETLYQALCQSPRTAAP